MFLTHLKQKIKQADAEYILYADINNYIVGLDGVTGEHVVFIKQHEDIDHALKVQVPPCQLPMLDTLLRLAVARGGGVFCCVSLGRFLQQVGQEMCQELPPMLLRLSEDVCASQENPMGL
ncbi:uncharacterized protein LOC122955750 [Acropora millepora]|uniref:uncharacterized protein LOC122955750 n=1 Tax=Acropora millepora TaxID=45264 RepID=UPI001CF51B10|nr:uncharacterized protein LOC122955750 [Acropora millepora]